MMPLDACFTDESSFSIFGIDSQAKPFTHGLRNEEAKLGVFDDVINLYVWATSIEVGIAQRLYIAFVEITSGGEYFSSGMGKSITYIACGRP